MQAVCWPKKLAADSNENYNINASTLVVTQRIIIIKIISELSNSTIE